MKKPQITNPKTQGSLKIQNSKGAQFSLEFDNWDFPGAWSLGFGISA